MEISACFYLFNETFDTLQQGAVAHHLQVLCKGALKTKMHR